MSDTVWIPAVPLPRKSCCSMRCGKCGTKFRKSEVEQYEDHWRREHEAALRESVPQVEVTREEADALYARAGVER